MRIINAMFSQGLGGIEQAFLNYCIALKAGGHTVNAVILPKAAIKDHLTKLGGINIIEIDNWGNWDLVAKSALKNIARQVKADVIISHGSRAAELFRGVSKRAKNIGVLHNYSVQRFLYMDLIFAVSQDLRRKIIADGMAENKVFYLPNMIALNNKELNKNEYDSKDKNEILTFGTLGRFVKKKGFDVFLQALALLKAKNYDFRVLIGGDGEEKDNLRLLCDQLNLEHEVSFLGWLKEEDRNNFYKKLDVFCLPSLHEPFGIVILEALKYSLSIVTTNTEGPKEILSEGQDALFVPKNDPVALAEALEKLIKDKNLRNNLAGNAIKTAAIYSIDVVGKTLNEYIKLPVGNI